MRVNCWRSCASSARRLRRSVAILGVHHDAVEECVDRRDAAWRAASAPPRSRACASARSTSRDDAGERFVQRLLRGLAQQRRRRPCRPRPASAFLRMLEMRLLAAVRLAASGSARNVDQRGEPRAEIQRRDRARWRAPRRTSPWSRRRRRRRCRVEEIRAQPLDHVVPQLVRPRSRSARAAARRRASTSARRSRSSFFSMRMRSTPMAARRRPNGSLVPLGFWPMAKMPASVSSLSASATAMPAPVAGSAPPAPRGM